MAGTVAVFVFLRVSTGSSWRRSTVEPMLIAPAAPLALATFGVWKDLDECLGRTSPRRLVAVVAALVVGRRCTHGDYACGLLSARLDALFSLAPLTDLNLHAPTASADFSIIAHQPRRSTSPTRVLELVHAVAAQDMRAQVPGRHQPRREHGITIKAQTIRVYWNRRSSTLVERAASISRTVSRFVQRRGSSLLVDAFHGHEARRSRHVPGDREQGPRSSSSNRSTCAATRQCCRKMTELVAASMRQDVLAAAGLAPSIAGCSRTQIIDVPASRDKAEHSARARLRLPGTNRARGVHHLGAHGSTSSSTPEPLRAMVQGTRFEAEERLLLAGAGAVARLTAAKWLHHHGLKDVDGLRIGDTLSGRRRPATAPRYRLQHRRDGLRGPLPGPTPISAPSCAGQLGGCSELKQRRADLRPQSPRTLGFGFGCSFLGLLPP